MLIRVGRWARPRLAVPVWSSGVGLARAMLALGTLGTLLATDPIALMSPLANGIVPPVCQGLGRAGIWCLSPDLAVGRWLSVAVLLLAVSGWRPRLTAVPHWYVSWSLINNATLQDGGDQITAVLTLLLLPVCLTDPRRWHWQALAPDPSTDRVPGLGRIVAGLTLLLIQVQVAVVYLQASVAKLGVEEWADGTAMYYWSHHPTFGSPPWLRPVTDVITFSPFGVAAMTWGSVALEFALALGIVLNAAARRVLLAAGLFFHGLIALDMGLVSFGAAMSGALLLYLLPVGHNLRWPARLGRWIGAVLRPAAPERIMVAAPPAPVAAVPQPSTASQPYLFVYDGDCGFCTASVHFARRRLRPAARHQVDFQPWRAVDLDRYGLTSQDVHHAVQLTGPDGSRVAGAAAFAHLAARHGRAAWPLLGHVLRRPPANWLAAGLYRFVAAHRHRLPGGSASCAVAAD